MKEKDMALDAEKQSKLRSKQLAILKASNQMLDEAKETIRNHFGSGDEDDDDMSEGILASIDAAQNENIQMGRTYLGAGKDEIDNAEFHGPSAHYVKKYEKRLESRNLTDEQVHSKKLISANTVTNSSKTRRRKKNQEEDIKEDNIAEIIQSKKNRVKGVGFDASGKKVNEDVETEKNEKKAKKTEKADVKVSGKGGQNTFIEKNVDTHKKASSEDARKFDLSDIPDYVQYDIIPLPSKGECYPHKKSRIPVAYLTAADENIIASPNMYRDGNLLDVILKRKILDRSIDVDGLCAGDRDAIILWLRATAYGVDFPIRATNPANGKTYDVTVKLDEFETVPFNLKGDENGWFTYTSPSGIEFKFCYPSYSSEDELKKSIQSEINGIEAVNIGKYCIDIRNSLGRCEMDEERRGEINECVDDIESLLSDEIEKIENEDIKYTQSITKQMEMYTMSINGNEDRDYIRNYIENMRAIDAWGYRDYIIKNRPGVDLSIDINVPESDGGGSSFSTFFRLEDTIFINI